MRLNRFLATCGFGSRRSCEALILDGHVTVNGEICRALATQVGPTDQVECGGRPAEMPQAITLIVHKPRGLVCTRSDERGRETIYSLLPSRFHGLHHVGRLDKDSEGLILLTNDGDLSQRLTHPSHKIQKEYLVTLDRAPEDADLKQLITGIPTEEGLARAVAYKRTSPRRIRVILQQGLKRQLRHMFEALDFRVKKLVRIRIGGLGIGLVPEGKWQLLDPPMLKALVEAEEIPNWQAEAKPRPQAKRFAKSPSDRRTPGRKRPAAAASRSEGGSERRGPARKQAAKSGDRRRSGDGSERSGRSGGSGSGESRPARKRPASRDGERDRDRDRDRQRDGRSRDDNRRGNTSVKRTGASRDGRGPRRDARGDRKRGR